MPGRPSSSPGTVLLPPFQVHTPLCAVARFQATQTLAARSRKNRARRARLAKDGESCRLPSCEFGARNRRRRGNMGGLLLSKWDVDRLAIGSPAAKHLASALRMLGTLMGPGAAGCFTGGRRTGSVRARQAVQPSTRSSTSRPASRDSSFPRISSANEMRARGTKAKLSILIRKGNGIRRQFGLIAVQRGLARIPALMASHKCEKARDHPIN